MDSAVTMAPTLISSPTCSFWSAQLNFSAPVSARHFCLLGHNRYTAPQTLGNCNGNGNVPTTTAVMEADEKNVEANSTSKPTSSTNSESCTTCMSLDDQQEHACNYWKGVGSDLGIVPPKAGYDDFSCPVGFNVYESVMEMNLECPLDSVLLLELFASTERTELYYDFDITTPKNVVRETEAHQCLTGNGGLGCGEDDLTILAYHEDGHCSLDFKSGRGYSVQCQNGFKSSSDFLGNLQKRNCIASNGFSCNELKRLNTEITVVVGDDEEYSEEICHLDDWSALKNPIALLVGAGVMLLTLVPGFLYLRVAYVSPRFLVGLLSEAIKNAGVMATIISVNWQCFLDHHRIIPTAHHSIFFPYALIAFTLTDTILTIIALVANWGTDLEGSFDQFKWIDKDADRNNNNNNLSRRIMTFLTICIFGGFGGLMQLGLIVEGTVDSDEDGISVWASWMFIVSVSLGGFLGVCLVLYGVFYVGNMRLAWKCYKFLVGNIAGIVSSVEIAHVLVPGWSFETFNDMVHLLLYLPGIMYGHK